MNVAFPYGGAGTYATALANKQLCGKWDVSSSSNHGVRDSALDTNSSTQVLSRLLELWREDKEQKNKVLIFSKSVKLLDFLSMWLGASGEISSENLPLLPYMIG